MYSKWHDYTGCYARVKGIWNVLESWLSQNTPSLQSELSGGANVDSLNQLLVDVGYQGESSGLSELLCSLLIHDGQSATRDHAGLFGGCEVYDYHINVRLLGVDVIRRFMEVLNNKAKQLPSWLEKCMPIAGSFNLQSVYFVVINDFTSDGRDFEKGEIVHHTSAFQFPVLEARSFSEWLERYTRDLLRNKYEIARNGEIIRFSTFAEDGSDVTTHHVRVQANALYLPPRSNFKPSTNTGTYFFAYRIRISMDKTAPDSAACRLATRHWLILNGNGNREEVNGPGVIGEYPLMRPGTKFEYCSCSPLNTPSGSMEGSFQFTLLSTKELINVEVGKFAFSIVQE